MTYRLVIVDTAERDVDEIYRYILARSGQGATAWYRAFLACLDRIVQQPQSCAVALEGLHFPFELRQAIFKTRLEIVYIRESAKPWSKGEVGPVP